MYVFESALIVTLLMWYVCARVMDVLFYAPIEKLFDSGIFRVSLHGNTQICMNRRIFEGLPVIWFCHFQLIFWSIQLLSQEALYSKDNKLKNTTNFEGIWNWNECFSQLTIALHFQCFNWISCDYTIQIFGSSNKKKLT